MCHMGCNGCAPRLLVRHVGCNGRATARHGAPSAPWVNSLNQSQRSHGCTALVSELGGDEGRGEGESRTRRDSAPPPLLSPQAARATLSPGTDTESAAARGLRPSAPNPFLWPSMPGAPRSSPRGRAARCSLAAMGRKCQCVAMDCVPTRDLASERKTDNSCTTIR
eukprot:gene8670-biopygen3943